MKKLLLRIAVYLLSFVLVVGGIGFYGLFRSQSAFYAPIPYESVSSLLGVVKPKYDPNKPTVAVLLGGETTEGSDFMIPYELFSRTAAFNVYAVAADNEAKRLTGGLDIIPHYSFEEMDQLLGKSPDIIAIPYITMLDEKKYDLVRQWILRHSNTNILTICNGSEALARTGLLNGKSAATHWQNMWFIPKSYPETNWIRDQRYVHDGNIVSSAGVSSGIDAVLYVISQKLGEPVAAKIAEEMKYPSYHFVKNPKMDPFDADMTTYKLNNAFHWNKTKAGVLLYDGVEEMALGSVYDIYSDTGTTKVLSISSSEQPIVTKYGLNLLSRHLISNAPKVDKMIVPGREAKSQAEEELKYWNERGNTKELLFIHSDSPDRFIFEAALEDLAKQEDLLTAAHAVKRLEYRANDIQLEGKPFPLETYRNALLTSLLALLVAFCIERRLIMKKTILKSYKQTS